MRKLTIVTMELLVGFLWLLCVSAVTCGRYQANWKSLDSRPLPGWYDESKIGIFLHWGVFAVPSYAKFDTAWMWYRWKAQRDPIFTKFMEANYRPDFTYPDFGPMFQAELFDPDKWAGIFSASGANYVVLTTKHHDGFVNWPSKYSFNWNAADVGPKKDLVGSLANAVRAKTKLRFGVYHSLYEWFHPLYLQDAANNYQTQDFVQQKTMPELYELVQRYKPDIVWSDGNWMAPDTYWNSTHFLAWLYNDSPVKDYVVVNDRWGNNTECKHGGFWDCADNFRPDHPPSHKWENCMVVDKRSWGYRRNADLTDFVTPEELIEQLVQTISMGGNLLVNVGPTAYGEISPIFEERLRQMGAWLKVNGEAIYRSHMWSHFNDSVAHNVWYTASHANGSATVYAILLGWPEKRQLTLGHPVASDKTRVNLVGSDLAPLPVKVIQGGGVTITLPDVPVSKLPCQWAWTLKITGLKNALARPRPHHFSASPAAIRLPRGDPTPWKGGRF